MRSSNTSSAANLGSAAMTHPREHGARPRLFRQLRQPQLAVDIGERVFYWHAVRVCVPAQFQHLLCADETPALQRRVEQNLLEQISLGMAAADFGQTRNHRFEFAPRYVVFAISVGKQALARR